MKNEIPSAANQNPANPANFAPPLFLSTDVLTRLVASIAKVVDAGGSDALGVWDAATGFAVVAEVRDGLPCQWHVRGPLSRTGAEHWLGLVAEEIHQWRPPQTTAH